jgi:Emfourin
MKVSIVRGGGLAGLVKTTAVDTDALSPEDAQLLREKVEAAGISDLPGELTSGGQQKDRFSYALTVEDAEGEHTVQASEEALPARIRSLVSWLDTVPQREERIERA